jgi:hypothetical protein
MVIWTSIQQLSALALTLRGARSDVLLHRFTPPQRCRVPPSGELQTPRTAGDRTYTFKNGKWRGELITHQHTEVFGVNLAFGGREVTCGFTGSYRALRLGVDEPGSRSVYRERSVVGFAR